jgi:hypothetical protein
MISKASLLKDIREKAQLEAKKRMLDEYETSDLVSSAEQMVEDFFGAITWTKVVGGTIQSKDSVDTWHHRQYHEFDSDWRCLEIDRHELQAIADRYLEMPWMSCSKMDWLILNVLTYAEYQGFVDALRSRTLSIEDYVSLRVGRVKSLGSKVTNSIIFALKWVLWVAIVCGLFWVWWPLGVCWLVYVGWGAWKRRAALKKISYVMQSLGGTYSTLSTVSQSWTIVWDQLNKSRSDGVVWDGVVYRLVEDRMKGKA